MDDFEYENGSVTTEETDKELSNGRDLEGEKDDVQ